jgi:hypothetical protein
MSYVVSTWRGGLRDDATKIDAPTWHWPWPWPSPGKSSTTAEDQTR